MIKKYEKEISTFIKKNLKWFILLWCALVFLVILKKLLGKEIMQSDMIGYQLIAKYLINDHITPVAKIITECGGTIVLVSLAILFWLVLKDKRYSLVITINLIVSTLLNILLKNIVQRPRPEEYRLIDESGYSFPSGHSMVSMAFYGLLIYLIYLNVKNVKLKWFLIIFLSFLIFAIGISRIYLGVHYTSDVLSGFLVSLCYLILYTSMVSNYLKKD